MFNKSQVFGKMKKSFYYLKGYAFMSFNYPLTGISCSFLNFFAFVLCHSKTFILKTLAIPQ